MPVCTPSYDIYTSTRACARMQVHAHVHTPPTHNTTHSWWMECIHPVPRQLYQLHVPPLVLIATVCVWDTHEDMTALGEALVPKVTLAYGKRKALDPREFLCRTWEDMSSLLQLSQPTSYP